ncbi:monocarboxylate transporter 11-like [Octopus sinensis]|uniref:Monocarboxylate transporter 11-like n=1 Tax=Octopus sinensis TaxID=2607531 RepID=A0A7E6EM39_9MOLL|nr:monocarboxylate transporter 11-like [Octopus sinensis]
MEDTFDEIGQLQFPEEFQLERELIANMVSLPLPPDGGWGWVIVSAAFIFNTIVDGILGGIGVLIPKIKTTFDVSLSTVSLIISIMYSLTYASGSIQPPIPGPLIGFLLDRFGVRPICLLSAVLASAAFISSYFVSNIVVLFFTLGIFPGIGGMVSRLVSGFIVGKLVDVFSYNRAAFYLIFVSLLLMPILRGSLPAMVLVCLAYGLCYGLTFKWSLLGAIFYNPSLIFCNVLGIRKLTPALTIHMFIKGIGYILGIIGFGGCFVLF